MVTEARRTYLREYMRKYTKTEKHKMVRRAYMQEYRKRSKARKIARLRDIDLDAFVDRLCDKFTASQRT
jgi:hypothetical protein